MSAITPSHAMPLPEPRAGDNYLTHSRGILSWLMTLDHKRIGIMYMVGVLASFALGGFFAVMLRTELINPGPTFFADRTAAWNFYNQMFSLHGAVMVFLFIIPAIPAILGNFILPLQLGAKDVAFPRLNLLSFYCWVGGAIFFIYVLIGGVLDMMFPGLKPALAQYGMAWLVQPGLDTGWTFYTPYASSTSSSGVVPATLGAFILGFSSILTAVNFMASIHMLRPKNMGWFDMPLFLWALYGTSLIQILATPVLAITLLLLVAERTLGVGIFDPALGGDPVLYQHFFWFYSHPAVYIMILPAMGVISELISTHSRKHIFGYSFIAFSSVAIALLGFLVWGHHMFVSGQSPLANAIFSLLTFSVAIPSAIKVFNWVSTLYKGDVRLTTPMLYALGFIVLFTFGGLTGLFLGAVATDVHLTATYFIVAHFHYVMVGSVLFALLGGFYHWWPKMFGVMPNQLWGNIAAVVLFIGFNVTFFVQFIAGSLGMPRRYATYPEKFTIFHEISTIGAYIMAVGLIMVMFNLLHSLLRGQRAPANPWGANSLEWHCSSPPPHDNFPRTPEAYDPYDFHRWQEQPDGSWVELPETADRPVKAH
ncbi:MAG: cbb3-type cytochrome c oxidase subunit I [Tepidisphaerales bacterium]